MYLPKFCYSKLEKKQSEVNFLKIGIISLAVHLTFWSFDMKHLQVNQQKNPK